MKTFGYAKRENINKHGLIEMSEVTLTASSSKLKEIAAFILKCVEEMEGENGYD